MTRTNNLPDDRFHLIDADQAVLDKIFGSMNCRAKNDLTAIGRPVEIYSLSPEYFFGEPALVWVQDNCDIVLNEKGRFSRREVEAMSGVKKLPLGT
jgi:hypothetical protein